RDLGIPPETVIDLIQRELNEGLKPKAAVKATRQKMHNIIAPYLGDPDYEQERLNLTEALQSADPQAEKDACLRILETHASTLERIPILDRFSQELFNVTGTPASIIDLACALHPFSLPWMNLPRETAYHAYDLHQPRVDLINHYFRLRGMRPLAEKRDILLDPPAFHADVAFLFKEAHRLEQRQRGCNLPLWQALNVEWLLVSLPVQSLGRGHDLEEKHRALVARIIEGQNWQMSEKIIENEMVFFIRKSKPSTVGNPD
ncbi:MAG: hypothetical protein JW750_07890, partial [Anaerolineaceae bacterium]|nr:hypothetical protein [Anaerolineaceae bacterium]